MKISSNLSQLFLIGTTLALAGCNQPAAVAGVPMINQADVCEVKSWQHDASALVCKPGQKIVFLPASFGNEQLPIMFAAVNCDMRYSIALTNGGVACIYAPMTPKAAAEPAVKENKP